MKGQILKRFLSCLAILFAAAISYGNDPAPPNAQSQTALMPRSPFRVPLARINITFDPERRQYNQVRIFFDESGAYSVIAPGDDMQVNRRGQTTVYREQAGRTFQLSDFEAQTINQVTRTLIATLEIFESILRNEDWGRALYLDAFLPRFLRGFHVMICAARDSPDALPRAALVREDDFDASLNSPKSDARIRMWQTEKDRIMVLRITTQELITQAKRWQRLELNNSKRNRELSYSGDFDRAFTAFIRNYFGYTQ
ncbi:MAG: hypothetical protein LBC70_01635 [Chitinispirillales bacterium]|jgi:hypothetical protein|nr:hypothetical protein [Chitinispirillales bacterium]